MKNSPSIIKRAINILFKDKSCHLILFYFLSILSLVFSLVFAYERIYGDAGYTIFTLVNSEHFVMISSRPISMVVEILPLLMVKMGISIDKILLVFSFNEWLWYFLCALILFYFYKKPTYAIAIYLLHIFSLQWNWFNPVSELIIASPLVFIVGAELHLLLQKEASYWRLLLLITLILFSHPLYSVLVPWFLVLYYFANKKDIKQIKFWTISGIILVIIVLHYFFLSGYDVDSATHAHGPGIFKSLRLKLVLNYIKAFPGLIFLVAISSYTLLIASRKKEIFLFVFTCLGYFLLVVHTYGQDFPETYEPYERYLFPIAIIIVFYWFVILQKSWNIFLLIIAAYNIFFFLSYANKVQTRYREFNYMLSNAQQWDQTKIYIRAENYYPGVNLGHDWTMPNESMILSSMMKSGTTKQVWVKEATSDDLLKQIGENSILASPFYVFSNNEVNTHYFLVKKGLPVCANTDSIQSTKPDSFFNNISIEPLSPYVAHKNSEILIPVKITNRNGSPLYSGIRLEQIYISYHWEKDGTIVTWDGLRTPIAMDVKRTSTQLIRIKTPENSGVYYLITDLIFEGKKWTNLSGKYYYNID